MLIRERRAQVSDFRSQSNVGKNHSWEIREKKIIYEKYLRELDRNLVQYRFGKTDRESHGNSTFSRDALFKRTIRWIGSRALIEHGGTHRSYDERSWLCKWNSSRVDRYGNQSTAQVSEFVIYLGNAGCLFVRCVHRCQILIIQMKTRATRGCVENNQIIWSFRYSRLHERNKSQSSCETWAMIKSIFSRLNHS